MRMPIVYVAGPFRGRTAWEVDCNVHNAEAMALEVAALGAVPLCPHAMYRHYDKTLTDQFWIDATAELLRKCDAAVFLDGWERSAGSVSEHNSAKNNGIKIFEQCEWLCDAMGWIDEWSQKQNEKTK